MYPWQNSCLILRIIGWVESMFHVPRTVCIEDKNHSISDFREKAAYALLGEPGLGKTSLFEQEAESVEDGVYVTARDFIDLDSDEWKGKTLFIDGLDEARAGKSDARTPLGAIRAKLDRLKCNFRISCREADWLGSPDIKDLEKVSSDKKIMVLHLNPLSDEDVKQIIDQDERVADGAIFFETAERIGLSDLLYNPQTLDMLIDAVKGGLDWPESKQQVYELAIKQLASEPNGGHQVAQDVSITIPQLIEAAGFVCAIELIANAPRVSLKSQAGEGLIALNELSLPDSPVNAALKARLFKKSDDAFVYVHRSVAEYLAAKLIAEKIKAGLPINRVLALVTGFDGGVVAALRGLMAWLCALSPQARSQLIEIDPLGVVVYGDAQWFSTETKKRLLNALLRGVEKNDNFSWQTLSFAALTTQDMADSLLEIFKYPAQEDAKRYIQYCLLTGLCHSECIPELKLTLTAMIRDSSYWGPIRYHALDAFMHQFPKDMESLLSLADNLRLGKFDDHEGRLMDRLLDKLFPDVIHASEIFNYLMMPDHYLMVVYYHDFWKEGFLKKLSDQDLIVVLDNLSSRWSSLLNMTHHDDLIDMLGQLLVRGLRTHGASIDNEKLYQWLGIGFDQFDNCLKQADQKEIGNWINENSYRYLNLLDEGIRYIQRIDHAHLDLYDALARLYDAKPPDNLGLWWLDRALSISDFNLSQACFSEAFRALQSKWGHQGLSFEFFEHWLADHPEFRKIYQALREPRHKRPPSEWKKQHQEALNARLSYLHEHEAQIAEGSAPPEIYHDLAKFFHPAKELAYKKRLFEYLNDDEALIAAAESGLRKIIERTDIPEPDEIFKLTVESRCHFIRLPFLVCMEILYREDASLLNRLSDDLASKALAFCLTDGALNDSWVKPIQNLRPSLAAQSWIGYAGAMLKKKNPHIYGLSLLADDDDYGEIAKSAVVPLLNQYPVRGTIELISDLKYLLKAALLRVERSELSALLKKKLAYKGMDVAQRICWLGVGLMIEPDSYESWVRKEVSGNIERLNHLSAFLSRGWRGDGYDLSVSVIGMLIELLAPRCNPERSTGVESITSAMDERNYVYDLMGKLRNNPCENSTNMLSNLLELPQLSAWHETIRSNLQTQQINRREASYQHPDAAQIIDTLNNSKPANVQDLAALAMEALEQLAKEMSGSNTDSYKHFWNEDSYSRPEKPKPEESCRNYLIERLEAKLSSYDVIIEPEAHQAKDKRADMKLSFCSNGKRFHLPVEIKRHYHADLWKAIHEQLIPLYTTAPETGGRGLFLVIWFNDKKIPTHPDGLPPPKTPGRLANMLKDRLTPQERKLIDVFVLDVSKPLP